LVPFTQPEGLGEIQKEGETWLGKRTTSSPSSTSSTKPPASSSCTSDSNTCTCAVVRSNVLVATFSTHRSTRSGDRGQHSENNYFTEMCSGSEPGSYLRRIDFFHGFRVIEKKTPPPASSSCTSDSSTCTCHQMSTRQMSTRQLLYRNVQWFGAPSGRLRRRASPAAPSHSQSCR